MSTSDSTFDVLTADKLVGQSNRGYDYIWAEAADSEDPVESPIYWCIGRVYDGYLADAEVGVWQAYCYHPTFPINLPRNWAVQ